MDSHRPLPDGPEVDDMLHGSRLAQDSLSKISDRNDWSPDPALLGVELSCDLTIIDCGPAAALIEVASY